MSNSWYKKSMPTIKIVKSSISDITKKISDIQGVKEVYAWGSYSKNINNVNYPIRDLDIIVKTNFISEDLLSISENPVLPFNLKASSLIEEGYNPKVVKFSKDFTSIKNFNIDHWVISKDKKVLHWGPTFETREEWESVKREAENFAKISTGLDRSKLNSDLKKQKWQNEHDYHINIFMSEMPNGWYQTSCKIKDIEEQFINLNRL